MKPTEQQLKDPQWWDSNVDSGLDFCYTTGKDWVGCDSVIGSFEFAGLENEDALVLGDKYWVLYCERPEFYGNNEKHDTVMSASKFIPEVGQWCEIVLKNEIREAFYIGLDSDDLPVFEYRNGDMLQEGFDLEFRPIKSERDVFIERAAEAICSASIEQLDVKGSAKRIAGILHDAGFKPPESEK